MSSIASFEKVSYEQFRKDFISTMLHSSDDIDNEDMIRQAYDNIKLPTRATIGSAGYDFYLPYGFIAAKDGWTTIPTGIRCKIDAGWLLMLCPKSGLGFTYNFKLANTVGIVDSDYYGSSNEGHIMAKVMTNDAVVFMTGQKFIQGVFLPFGTAEDDQTKAVRNGGFGSTGK